MKTTIGSAWIFQLVIIFTLIFAAYIALTINYSKSFRVKNEVISIIEKSEGLTENAVSLINNYLSQSGYATVGYCSDVNGSITFGAKSLDPSAASSSIEQAEQGKKYYYCVNKIIGNHSYYKTRAYYKVKLFFKFDLPVIGDLNTFDVDGQTTELDFTYDGDDLTKWAK